MTLPTVARARRPLPHTLAHPHECIPPSPARDILSFEQPAAHLDTEMVKWGAIIQARGIRGE
ncbi:hypothetical protein [Variovorax sp. PvP013]|uniref:hypothetical protein n=1 Tax=Variovorax sp. PvP013 TaxID=3156435 RepID=UPI003D22D04C